MKAELRLALERVGWDQLYEAHLPDLSSPNSRGERTACSPFSDVEDTNPSFSVNTVNGLWHCFKSQRGGNYVQFRALLEATEVDDNDLLIPSPSATEARLLQEFQVVGQVDPDWVYGCAQLLAESPDLLHRLQLIKPWCQPTLRLLNVGYDLETNRLVFPVNDRAGRLVNARLYLPGGSPKAYWRVAGATANLLWPHQAWQDPTVILVEGEPDALSLRCLGFAAASGTMGAGQPVPEGLWWRRRHVYVWLDADEAGERGTALAVQGLLGLAASVWVVSLPGWEGRPAGADVSDYLLHLASQGLDREACQAEVRAVLQAAQLVEQPSSRYDQPGLTQTFGQAVASTEAGQRLDFSARLLAKGDQRYLMPVSYELICPAQGHQYCVRCPMRADYHGRAELTHDPRDPLSLRLFNASQKEQLEALKEQVGIPLQCPDPHLLPQALIGVEPVVLTASLQEGESQPEAVAECQRQDAYLLSPPPGVVEEGRDYRLSGFVYPHPRTQRAVFMVDRLTPLQSAADGFTLTPELVEGLRAFQPQADVLGKLQEVADDLSRSVTLIYGRQDLHLAYRTVWHSVLKFTLGGAPIDRGWLEALIIGDTRTGKSQSFRRLARYYQMGLLIDCKMQSAAGVLGSVVTSPVTGERYVVAGAYPQQDGRVVGFDEFHRPKWGGYSLIEHLASSRSEGVVRITKAASAQFHARVRSLWLGNPGQGELLSELGTTGVEVIRELVPQPEDVARFDLAVAVSKDDVPMASLNLAAPPQATAYQPHLARALLLWTHSRQPHQVQFTDGAVQATLRLAEQMTDRYDATIPLVEPADQRGRVAKVAVSVAAQCFSTDAEAEVLTVRPEHVTAVGQLYQLWFDKPAMGYDVFSTRQRRDRQVADPTAVLHLLETSVAPHGQALARQLLALDEFSERSFGLLVPGLGALGRSILQQLYVSRCIKLAARGRRDAFQLTPAGTALLRSWLAEQAH